MARAEEKSAPKSDKGLNFRADYYRRDLNTNTIVGKGNAWVKSGTREIFADEIEVLLNEERVNANGNVHLQDGAMHLWGMHATFNLHGDDATLENARLIMGQLVVSGRTLRRIDKESFEVEDGTYSNCNVGLLNEPGIADCPMDWKISGRRFSIRLGAYAHFYDVLVQAKDIPLMYTPYLVIPIKNERQSGLLMPYVMTYANLGSGVSLPIYLALSPWQDLTVTPTYYTKTGMHITSLYRYNYDGKTLGNFDLFTTGRRYSADRNHPKAVDPSHRPILGVLGESAINAHNLFYLNSKSHFLQVIRWVSHPYYTFDYPDLTATDLGYLRSQFSLIHPFDEYLFSATAQYHQSLIVSRDEGVDQGPSALLPGILFSKASSPLLGKWLSFELDTAFNNYYRPRPYDPLPDLLDKNGVNIDSTPGFDSNDYLRTGQRVQLEPRLVAHVPMPRGLQLQPLLRTGSLLYHFSYPHSSIVHREYAEIEVPFTLYLSRLFHTDIPGFEQFSHVLQPRVVFASSFYQSKVSDHPFFYQDTTAALANPRFDLTDQMFPYEYLRFEFINRFRRKAAATKSVERFWLLQFSEQFNTKTSILDPRYQSKLGPIEALSDLRLWRFSLQLQGFYQLEATRSLNGVPLSEPVHENEWSSTLGYDDPGGDRLRVNSLFRYRADPANTDQIVSLNFFKTLPILFDLEGQMEYSMRKGQLRGYQVGFHFRERPRSCWRFSLRIGRNAYYQQFALFNFLLDFGSPAGF